MKCIGTFVDITYCTHFFFYFYIFQVCVVVSLCSMLIISGLIPYPPLLNLIKLN